MNYDAFWQLWEAEQWEQTTKEWVERVVRPGDLFVDVGAWVGPVSLWALSRGAYVIAVEPDPLAAAELRATLSSAVNAGAAEVWEAAMVAAAGEEAMLAASPRPGGEWGDSQSIIAPELEGCVRVPAFTLEAVLQGRVPKAVKIDVEGYETRLCPAIMPWLAGVGAYVHVSLHGTQLGDVGLWAQKRFTPDPRWGDYSFEPRQ